MSFLPVSHGFAPSISVSGQTPRRLRFTGGGREENVETVALEPLNRVFSQKAAAGKREMPGRDGVRRRE
jgi:hypothetical protein